MGFKKQHLSQNDSVYFIAEIGINHNGFFDMAIQMIDESAEAGASAVKFQKRNKDYLLIPGVELETPTGYLSKSPDDKPEESMAFGTWTYPDLRLEFTDEQHVTLRRHAEAKGLDYIISPWDEDSLEFLAKTNAKAIKIASIDTSNYLFMKSVAAKKIPVVASVGMCNWSEIHKTWKIFAEAKCPLMFLHCTSAYPSELKDKNLNCIPILQQMFSEDVGFSGHGIGFTGTLGAVALGARVVEKHVTLSRDMSGPDQNASLEFDEFSQLVGEANNILEAMGSTNKEFLASEEVLHGVLSKKFTTSKRLNKGDKLHDENLRTVVTKKPGGILPNNYYDLVGKTIARDLDANHVLEFSDLAS